MGETPSSPDRKAVSVFPADTGHDADGLRVSNRLRPALYVRQAGEGGRRPVCGNRQVAGWTMPSRFRQSAPTARGRSASAWRKSTWAMATYSPRPGGATTCCADTAHRRGRLPTSDPRLRGRALRSHQARPLHRRWHRTELQIPATRRPRQYRASVGREGGGHEHLPLRYSTS